MALPSKLKNDSEFKRFWSQRDRVSNILKHKIQNPNDVLIVSDITTDILDEECEAITMRPTVTCSSGIRGNILMVADDENSKVQTLKILKIDENQPGLYGPKYSLSENKFDEFSVDVSDITCGMNFMFITAKVNGDFNLYAIHKTHLDDGSLSMDPGSWQKMTFRGNFLNPKTLSGWPRRNKLYVHFLTGYIQCFEVKEKDDQALLVPRKEEPWIIDDNNIRFISAPYSKPYMIAVSTERVYLYIESDNHNPQPVQVLDHNDGITPIRAFACRNDAGILIANSKVDEGHDDNVLWVIPFHENKDEIDVSGKFELISGSKHGLGNPYCTIFDWRGNLWFSQSDPDKTPQQVFLIARHDWKNRLRVGQDLQRAVSKTRKCDINIKDVTKDVIKEVDNHETISEILKDTDNTNIEFISTTCVLVSTGDSISEYRDTCKVGNKKSMRKSKLILMSKQTHGFQIETTYDVPERYKIGSITTSCNFLFFTIEINKVERLYAVHSGTVLKKELKFNIEDDSQTWQKIENLPGNSPKCLSGWPDRDIVYVGMGGCLARFQITNKNGRAELTLLGSVWKVGEDEQVEDICAAYSKQHVFATVIDKIYVFDKYGGATPTEVYSRSHEKLAPLFPFNGLWCRDDKVLLVSQCEGDSKTVDVMKKAVAVADVQESLISYCEERVQALEDTQKRIRDELERGAQTLTEMREKIENQCKKKADAMVILQESIIIECKDSVEQIEKQQDALMVLQESLLSQFKKAAKEFETQQKEIIRRSKDVCESVLEETIVAVEAKHKAFQEMNDCIMNNTVPRANEPKTTSSLWAIPLTESGLDLSNIKIPLLTGQEGLKQANKVLVGYDGNLWMSGTTLQILSVDCKKTCDS